MGYGNERMDVSESPLITHDPLSQQNHQYPDLFSLLDQQNFNINNINSHENHMEHRNSTESEPTCSACSDIFKANMPCLQLTENCQL